MKIVSTAEMKACDLYTIEKLGVPSLILMEHAALAVVEEMLRIENLAKCKILVACGSGNNGGDGFAIARLLHVKGYPVEILFVGNPEHLSQETAIQKKICENYQIPLHTQIPEKADYAVLVDAILGIGLKKNVYPQIGEVIDQLNRMKLFVFAVDLPSGLSGDNGAILGKAIRADKTITFQFKKFGLTKQPAKQFAGEILVKDIGISGQPLIGR